MTTPRQVEKPKEWLSTHARALLDFAKRKLGGAHLPADDKTLRRCAALYGHVGTARGDVMLSTTEVNKVNSTIQSNFDYLNSLTNQNRTSPSSSEAQKKDAAQSVFNSIQQPHMQISSKIKNFQAEREKLLAEINKVTPLFTSQLNTLLSTTKPGQDKTAEIEKLKEIITPVTKQIRKHIEDKKTLEKEARDVQALIQKQMQDKHLLAGGPKEEPKPGPSAGYSSLENS